MTVFFLLAALQSKEELQKAKNQGRTVPVHHVMICFFSFHKYSEVYSMDYRRPRKIIAPKMAEKATPNVAKIWDIWYIIWQYSWHTFVTMLLSFVIYVVSLDTD